MENYDFTTIYFKPSFNVGNIEFNVLEELFGVVISEGDSNYINVYTIDRSVVDSIINELGESNVEEISYA